jgi:hypothetical protein
MVLGYYQGLSNEKYGWNCVEVIMGRKAGVYNTTWKQNSL